MIGVAPAERAGATSGLLETSSELGGAVGIAVLGSVLNLVYRMAFPADLAVGQAGTSLAGAAATAKHLDKVQASNVLDAARGAFVEGASVAAWVGVGVLVSTALLVVWMTRTSDVADRQESAELRRLRS